MSAALLSRNGRTVLGGGLRRTGDLHFHALGQPLATATLADAKAFAAVLSEAQLTEVPGAGLGEELHLSSHQVAGVGLRWDGAICHLSAFTK